MKTRVPLPQIHETLMMFLSLALPYKWGGKARPLSTPRPITGGLDCSGAVQWILYHASAGALTLPEGSTQQREFIAAQGFERVPYSLAANDNSGAVYVCFAWGVASTERHVWIVRMRASWESWGGHGTGVRSPQTLWHRLKCRACYRIT